MGVAAAGSPRWHPPSARTSRCSSRRSASPAQLLEPHELLVLQVGERPELVLEAEHLLGVHRSRRLERHDGARLPVVGLVHETRAAPTELLAQHEATERAELGTTHVLRGDVGERRRPSLPADGHGPVAMALREHGARDTSTTILRAAATGRLRVATYR